MRHGKKVSKLSRPAEHRRAMLNNLAAALITHKQIQTTDTKAKALKPYIDRLISTARENTLQARRLVAQSMPHKEAFKELFNVIVPKLEGRTSGFSRIVKYGHRRGDGASLSIIQLLLEKSAEEKSSKKGKKKASAEPAVKKIKEEKPAEPETRADAAPPEEIQQGEPAPETAEEQAPTESSPEEDKQ